MSSSEIGATSPLTGNSSDAVQDSQGMTTSLASWEEIGSGAGSGLSSHDSRSGRSSARKDVNKMLQNEIERNVAGMSLTATNLQMLTNLALNLNSTVQRMEAKMDEFKSKLEKMEEKMDCAMAIKMADMANEMEETKGKITQLEDFRDQLKDMTGNDAEQDRQVLATECPHFHPLPLGAFVHGSTKDEDTTKIVFTVRMGPGETLSRAFGINLSKTVADLRDLMRHHVTVSRMARPGTLKHPIPFHWQLHFVESLLYFNGNAITDENASLSSIGVAEGSEIVVRGPFPVLERRSPP